MDEMEEIMEESERCVMEFPTQAHLAFPRSIA